jgi:hypothetical protein
MKRMKKIDAITSILQKFPHPLIPPLPRERGMASHDKIIPIFM